MSTQSRPRPVTVRSIARRKGDSPIVCLTAYTTSMACILDPLVDILLVGDSLGMVLYGMDTTLGVSLDAMVAHGRAVARGADHACVIVDLPFGSYQESPVQAFRSAARVMAETGCAGVKLEGGSEMAETVAFLVARGVPVLGHVGLTPQSVHALGGYLTQGRSQAEAARIVVDAEAIADAGAFAVVVEATVEPVAREITERIAVPTIGIGASPACDGQILVTEDLLGLTGEMAPRFVKRYAALDEVIAVAVTAFAEDVRERRFPGKEHCVAVAETPT